MKIRNEYARNENTNENFGGGLKNQDWIIKIPWQYFRYKSRFIVTTNSYFHFFLTIFVQNVGLAKKDFK